MLRPLYRIPYLKLWSSFYVNRYRYDHVHDASKAAELEALKLEDRYEVTKFGRTYLNPKIPFLNNVSDLGQF